MEVSARNGNFYVANAFSDMNAANIAAAVVVWTPSASNKTLRLLGGTVSVSVAGSVLFTDNSGAGATLFRTPQLLANTPYYFDLGNGRALNGANHSVYAILTTNGTITGTLFGAEEQL